VESNSILPKRVKDLCAQAEKFILSYRERKGFPPHFVASDYGLVYEVLEGEFESNETFLEWGSGVGTITIMADMLGFEAYGIEIDGELVSYAEELAEKHQSEARFVAGSLVPDEYDWSTALVGEESYTDPSSGDGYDILDMSLEGFDVVFGYPWPGEESFFEDIFEKHARPGALLITYNGLEGIKKKRKELRSIN